MEEPKFKPDDDGFYRIKNSQKNDLKKFLMKQMEGNPRTAKGNLSKKGTNVKTIITDGADGAFETVFKEKGGDWRWNDKAALDASYAKRSKNLELSNTINTPEQIKAFSKKQKSLKKGQELDHIYEVQETGPMVEQIDLEEKYGAIDAKEAQRQRQILKDTGIGDNLANSQVVDGKVNTIKATEVSKKNKALEAMELRNPSNRALKLVKSKAGKFILKRALPGVGGAIVLSQFGGAVHAATKEGINKKTATNLAFRSADLALEGLDVATGGISTPVTLALQLALAGAENTINQGAAKISTSDRKKFR
tara:strand:+ start:711 stop:1631 length:921 start_codon:yes stop_codon:yes gene_type:complete